MQWHYRIDSVNWTEVILCSIVHSIYHSTLWSDSKANPHGAPIIYKRKCHGNFGRSLTFQMSMQERLENVNFSEIPHFGPKLTIGQSFFPSICYQICTAICSPICPILYPSICHQICPSLLPKLTPNIFFNLSHKMSLNMSPKSVPFWVPICPKFNFQLCPSSRYYFSFILCSLWCESVVLYWSQFCPPFNQNFKKILQTFRVYSFKP